jgi:hypothetical protein
MNGSEMVSLRERYIARKSVIFKGPAKQVEIGARDLAQYTSLDQVESKG